MMILNDLGFKTKEHGPSANLFLTGLLVFIKKNDAIILFWKAFIQRQWFNAGMRCLNHKLLNRKCCGGDNDGPNKIMFNDNKLYG